LLQNKITKTVAKKKETEKYLLKGEFRIYYFLKVETVGINEL